MSDLFAAEPAGAVDAPAAPVHHCHDCSRARPSTIVRGFLSCTLMAKWEFRTPLAGCHFRPSRWTQWVDSPKAAAQAGIDQAVAHAERVRPGWSDEALAYIRTFSAAHKGLRLTGYELVQHSVQAGFEQPITPQGWGGPLQRAARAGLLVKVGSVPDPNPARHGSDVPLWLVA